MAALSQRTPARANMQVIIDRDRAAGHFGHGQTIADVAWDLKQWPYYHDHEGHLVRLGSVTLLPFQVDGYDAGQLTYELQRIASNGKGFIVAEVALAYRLPANEQGVNYHFVALVGYDSEADKILVANGDQVPTSATTHAPLWMDLVEVSAARVVGMVIVEV